MSRPCSMTHEAREEVGREAEVVEDGDHRRAVALVEVAQELHRLDLVAEVEVDGRLVEEHDRRGLRDGEREQHELPLPERELAGVPAHEMPEARRARSPRRRRPVRRPGAAQRGLVRQPPEADDLLDAHRERERRLLRDHGEAARDLGALELRDRDAAERARGRRSA